MRFVFVHNHIYKNAGSTVDAVFEGAGFRHLAIEATPAAPLVHPHRVVDAVRADAQLDFISSHSFADPRPADLEDVGFVDITFVRHPIDRLYSIYTYSRQPGVSDFASIPRTATFAEFIDGVARNEPAHLHSPQTTCLGNHRNFYFPPGPAALDRARATVADTRFLGVVDRLEASFAVFVACCRGLMAGKDVSRLEGPFEAVNRSATRTPLVERLARIEDELGRERYRWVESANACDMDLYRYACDELSRRHAAVFGSGQ
jgi:hypothetical protein